MLETNRMPADPLVSTLFGGYEISKMGMAMGGFNWETGRWGTMPLQVIEAYQIIDRTISAYHEEQRDKQKQALEANQTSASSVHTP